MHPVQYASDAGVATITLDDHPNRNALGAEMIAAIDAALSRALADDTVRSIVLTHTGDVFCAGANLKQRPADAEAQLAWSRTFAALLDAIASSPKPVVARVDGPALAGGMGLVCAADIAVASERAVFGLTEVRVGVAAAIVSVVCLRRLGSGAASELMLRGNRIDANEAVRIGLVQHAVAADQLDATVAAITADFALGAPGALAATKRVLAEVPTRTTDDAFEWAAQLSAELFRSAEASEGMIAFTERRQPTWARSADGGG